MTSTMVYLHCCNCGQESVGGIVGESTPDGFVIDSEDRRNTSVALWMNSHQRPMAAVVGS